jgi:hypothetical protein
MSEKLETVQLAPRENAFLGVNGYPSEKPFNEETSRAMDGEVLPLRAPFARTFARTVWEVGRFRTTWCRIRIGMSRLTHTALE